MAGPNMEVFRFGFYLFFPILVMYKFGDPEWYAEYVQPYRDQFIPPEEKLKTPQSAQTLREELARLKAERLARQGASSSAPNGRDVRVDQALAAQRDQRAQGEMGSGAAREGETSRWAWASTGSSSGRLV